MEVIQGVGLCHFWQSTFRTCRPSPGILFRCDRILSPVVFSDFPGSELGCFSSATGPPKGAFQIPTSIKSGLLAWSLPILLLIWTLGGAIGFVIGTDHHVELDARIEAIGIPLAAFLAWLFLLIVPNFLRASRARAFEIANLIGMPAERLAALEAVYQRKNAKHSGKSAQAQTEEPAGRESLPGN